jgi:ankyrin repeat protein
VASVRGHQAIVELLLIKGADINTQGGYYSNILQAALYEAHQPVVELLLIKGADINT